MLKGETTVRELTGRDAKRVGVVTMVAGAAFALAALGSIATEAAWALMLVGFASLVYVVPKLHRHQAPGDRWPGALGAWLVPAGAGIVLALGLVYLVWQAVGDPGEPGWVGPVWMIGFFSFAVGVVLFGVGSVIARKFTPVAPALMLLGLVGALAIDMATGAFFQEEGGPITEWGLYIGVPLFGFGLAWMGYQLWAPERGADTAGALQH